MNKVIINLNKVVKSFQVKDQDVAVLRGTDLEIYDGDFAIIFGPSGCGKSTLLHVILGLEEPTSGSTSFFDKNLYAGVEDSRAEFRKNNIGMVYQQPNWIKSLSVVENVAFVLSLVGVEKQTALQKARDVLEVVEMLDWADYRPLELSSGQQQKVALARAIVSDPKVIIADEPSGNLDYQSGIELMELFKHLNAQGKTIIMVSHNIDNLDYGKRIVQMFNGRIVTVFDTTTQPINRIKKLLLEHVTPQTIPDQKTLKKQDQTPLREKWHWHPPTFSLKWIKTAGPKFVANISQILRFLGLLWIYITQKVTDKLLTYHFLPKRARVWLQTRLDKVYSITVSKLERNDEKSISWVDLIDLSVKNMLSKGTRTVITIGGMAIGVATIVFLVSIGYGLEKLVISRVARLEEMRQIDATPAAASNVKLTDASLAQFKDIAGVSKILPVVGVVGTINYQNSSTDVAIYGVLSDYLKESAIKPVEGAIFESDALAMNDSRNSGTAVGMVAGISDSIENHNAVVGEQIGEVTFTIYPNQYVRVREKPSAGAKLLGFTKRVEGVSQAVEYWGGTYTSESGVGRDGKDKSGNDVGRWLKAKVLLWEETTTEDGETTYTEKLNEDGSQASTDGYFAQLNMAVEGQVVDARVLGVSTTDAQSASDSGFIDIASLEESATPAAEIASTKITLPDSGKREAVVNRALLKVLGIENAAVGKTFSIAFTATGELVQDNNKIESVPVEYTIVGVIPDTKTPILYVPIRDIKQMGIQSYSQAKIVVGKQDELSKIRKQLELLGFKTTSVVDTVSQIENLFVTLRMILAVIGIVALSVAALGMLNTLTVSLLERTREVGMMKAIGMKSIEVQDLYLTESMIMGVMGGIGGLILGFLAGKITSAVLSVFAVSKGYGVLDISFIPYPFVLLILGISLAVGLLTGIYPSRRATKISALNALRYE